MDHCRHEVLPFGSVVEQADAVGEPLTLTVTCSPKQGPDRTVELAGELRTLGHTVIVHIAARMVIELEHLDALLSAMTAADVHHAFVLGGDTTEATGSYRSALELLTDMRAHRDAPATIGVGAYPEGHPLRSVEYWSDRTMFASAANKHPLTAATMPGRSEHVTSNRIINPDQFLAPSPQARSRVQT